MVAILSYFQTLGDDSYSLLLSSFSHANQCNSLWSQWFVKKEEVKAGP